MSDEESDRKKLRVGTQFRERTSTIHTQFDTGGALPCWVCAAFSPYFLMLWVEAQTIAATSIVVPPTAHGVLVAPIASLVELGGQRNVSIGAIGKVTICSHR